MMMTLKRECEHWSLYSRAHLNFKINSNNWFKLITTIIGEKLVVRRIHFTSKFMHFMSVDDLSSLLTNMIWLISYESWFLINQFRMRWVTWVADGCWNWWWHIWLIAPRGCDRSCDKSCDRWVILHVMWCLPRDFHPFW